MATANSTPALGPGGEVEGGAAGGRGCVYGSGGWLRLVGMGSRGTGSTALAYQSTLYDLLNGNHITQYLLFTDCAFKELRNSGPRFRGLGFSKFSANSKAILIGGGEGGCACVCVRGHRLRGPPPAVPGRRSRARPPPPSCPLPAPAEPGRARPVMSTRGGAARPATRPG